MRTLLIGITTMLMSLQVWSFNMITPDFQASVKAMAQTTGLDWKVGDFANYNFSMGFIQGTNNMSIREVGPNGIWLIQDMDLGFMGKQLVEALIDPNTGEIKELKVNGQAQDIPENNSEIVSAEESSVTVPAGTFDAIYIKLKNNDDGKISQIWINPEMIPLNGSAKSISPAQFGDAIMELTQYGRAN